MKQYVREFANDRMKHYDEETKERIKTILVRWFTGFITDLEAVQVICAICYDKERNNTV